MMGKTTRLSAGATKRDGAKHRHLNNPDYLFFRQQIALKADV